MDATKDEMKIFVVGLKGVNIEPKWEGMPTKNDDGFKGWVPHLNAYATPGSQYDSAGCEIRVCSISPDCYGEVIQENIFNTK